MTEDQLPPGGAENEEDHEAEVIEGLWGDVAQPPLAEEAEASGLVAVEGGPDPYVPVQEVFIPVHKFIRLTEREVEVIDHPAFQRLGYVFQLGHTYLVYRGATHQRHEHSLGTLHVAQMFIDALTRNAQVGSMDPNTSNWMIDRQLSKEEVTFIRLGALLHDLGHLPAGHTFEDELGLFPKHDSLERLDLVLGRKRWSAVEGEPLEELIDRLYRTDVETLGIDASATELLRALIAGDYDTHRGGNGLGETSAFRLSVGRDLIGNTICADLLDYLHRDFHHLGKHKEFDTRLIDYMEIRRNEESDESRLVVYLRDGDRVRHDAVSAVLGLLESRYELFEAALYHRTKLAATAMLERSVAEIADHRDSSWTRDLPTELLELSDSEMLAWFRDAALESHRRTKAEIPKERLGAAAASLTEIRQRKLQKRLYQRFREQFSTPDFEQISRRYGHDPDAGGTAAGSPARNRLRALRRLEDDFSLPPLSLGMYCPPPKMSSKVAGVSILRDGDVRTLAQEEERDERLTGGHLRAQEQRFANLWHVYFCCDEDVLEDLQTRNLRPLLIDAIDCFVLGLSPGPVDLEERARTIARAISASPESHWHRREVVDSIPVASRGKKAADCYPTGLSSLEALFVEI